MLLSLSLFCCSLFTDVCHTLIVQSGDTGTSSGSQQTIAPGSFGEIAIVLTKMMFRGESLRQYVTPLISILEDSFAMGVYFLHMHRHSYVCMYTAV
jgi:hypothetical protein